MRTGRLKPPSLCLDRVMTGVNRIHAVSSTFIGHGGAGLARVLRGESDFSVRNNGTGLVAHDTGEDPLAGLGHGGWEGSSNQK